VPHSLWTQSPQQATWPKTRAAHHSTHTSDGQRLQRRAPRQACPSSLGRRTSRGTRSTRAHATWHKTQDTRCRRPARRPHTRPLGTSHDLQSMEHINRKPSERAQQGSARAKQRRTGGWHLRALAAHACAAGARAQLLWSGALRSRSLCLPPCLLARPRQGSRASRPPSAPASPPIRATSAIEAASAGMLLSGVALHGGAPQARQGTAGRAQRARRRPRVAGSRWQAAARQSHPIAAAAAVPCCASPALVARIIMAVDLPFAPKALREDRLAVAHHVEPLLLPISGS